MDEFPTVTLRPTWKRSAHDHNYPSCLAKALGLAISLLTAPELRSHFEACLHKARITAHAKKIDANRHMMANKPA
jgi:hypothetical protein